MIGGAPAAAVVFAREVDVAHARRRRASPGSTSGSRAAEGAERERLRAERDAEWTAVRAEKLGELAAEFDAIHSVAARRRGRLGRPHRDRRRRCGRT